MWAVHSLEIAGQRRRGSRPASSAPLAAGLRLLLGQLELLGQLAGWSNQLLKQLNHCLFGLEPHRQQQQQLVRQAGF